MGGTARGPAQSCTGALPLHERSYGSAPTGATFREHVFTLYIALGYIYQNTSSGWDSYPAPIDHRSNALTIVLFRHLVTYA